MQGALLGGHGLAGKQTDVQGFDLAWESSAGVHFCRGGSMVVADGPYGAELGPALFWGLQQGGRGRAWPYPWHGCLQGRRICNERTAAAVVASYLMGVLEAMRSAFVA